MGYNHALGMIPGYDALVKYNAKIKRQQDWERNVGSKGRRIAYADRRPDYGATSTAFREITGAVGGMVGSAYLPFRMARPFLRSRPRRIYYRGRFARGYLRYR